MLFDQKFYLYIKLLSNRYSFDCTSLCSNYVVTKMVNNLPNTIQNTIKFPTTAQTNIEVNTTVHVMSATGSIWKLSSKDWLLFSYLSVAFGYTSWTIVQITGIHSCSYSVDSLCSKFSGPNGSFWKKYKIRFWASCMIF